MVRYISQHTENECAPIALLNILKWLGRPYSYKDSKEVRKALCFDIKEGVDILAFSKTLREYGISFSFRKAGKVADIIRHLRDGGICAVNTLYKEKDEEFYHVYLVVSVKQKFHVVNYDGHPGGTVYLTTKELRRSLSKRREHYGGAVWFIEPDAPAV